MALSGAEPRCLITRRPTTTHSGVRPGQNLSYARELRRMTPAVLFITTRISSVVAWQNVMVMYSDRIVEQQESPTSSPADGSPRELIKGRCRLHRPGSQHALRPSPAPRSGPASDCPFHPRCDQRLCLRRAGCPRCSGRRNKCCLRHLLEQEVPDHAHVHRAASASRCATPSQARRPRCCAT